MPDPYADVTPDGKDWTWTLDRPCPDCGFAAGEVARDDIAALTRAASRRYVGLAGRADLTQRPDPGVWSPLEYACHVRDVCLLFDERVRLMLTQDDPPFANWDQDETARAQRYDVQDPAVVLPELARAAARIASTYDGLSDGDWDRPGRRSDGSVFTVRTLGQYFLHDVYHHLDDVGA